MVRSVFVQACYLKKAGLDVCVLERRHVIGGAAVTEEIVPGLNLLFYLQLVLTKLASSHFLIYTLC